jgi:hypothetical protein
MMAPVPVTNANTLKVVASANVGGNIVSANNPPAVRSIPITTQWRLERDASIAGPQKTPSVNAKNNVATISPVTDSASPARANALARATATNPVETPMGRAIGSQRIGRHRDMEPSLVDSAYFLHGKCSFL